MVYLEGHVFCSVVRLLGTYARVLAMQVGSPPPACAISDFPPPRAPSTGASSLRIWEAWMPREMRSGLNRMRRLAFAPSQEIRITTAPFSGEEVLSFLRSCSANGRTSLLETWTSVASTGVPWISWVCWRSLLTCWDWSCVWSSLMVDCSVRSSSVCFWIRLVSLAGVVFKDCAMFWRLIWSARAI